MNRAATFACLLLGLFATTGRAAPPTANDSAVRGSVSLARTWTDRRYAIGSREYDEELGYRRFRLSSTRSFAAFSATLFDDITATVRAGLSTLATHASEGETLEFENAISWGLGVRFPFYRWPNRPHTGFYGTVDLFSASADDGEVTRTHRDYWLAGDPSIKWLETAAALEFAADLGHGTHTAAGLRYLTMDVSQERLILGQRRTVEFDAEDDWGAYLRVRCDLSPHFALFGGIHVLDETGFTAGLDVGF
jgi:hypothetical protein